MFGRKLYYTIQKCRRCHTQQIVDPERRYCIACGWRTDITATLGKLSIREAIRLCLDLRISQLEPMA